MGAPVKRAMLRTDVDCRAGGILSRDTRAQSSYSVNLNNIPAGKQGDVRHRTGPLLVRPSLEMSASGDGV